MLSITGVDFTGGGLKQLLGLQTADSKPCNDLTGPRKKLYSPFVQSQIQSRNFRNQTKRTDDRFPSLLGPADQVGLTSHEFDNIH